MTNALYIGAYLLIPLVFFGIILLVMGIRLNLRNATGLIAFILSFFVYTITASLFYGALVFVVSLILLRRDWSPKDDGSMSDPTGGAGGGGGFGF